MDRPSMWLPSAPDVREWSEPPESFTRSERLLEIRGRLPDAVEMMFPEFRPLIIRQRLSRRHQHDCNRTQ
jgi:hypothetical protein